MFEVTGVAGDKNAAVADGDGCNLAIGDAHGATSLLVLAHESAVDACGVLIERQYAILECLFEEALKALLRWSSSQDNVTPRLPPLLPPPGSPVFSTDCLKKHGMTIA